MANDPQTFSELKTVLAFRADRDDLEETDILNQIIAEAERTFQREILIPEREGTTTLEASSASVVLPVDFQGLRTVYVDGSTDTPLDQVTPTKLRDLYPTSATGVPRHFAIEGENMLLGPAPATSSNIKLTYIQKFVPLSDSNATNWLLTDHPDLYIHTCLGGIFEFNLFPDKANEHFARATAIMNSVNRAARRRINNSGPLTARSPVRQVNRHARA